MTVTGYCSHCKQNVLLKREDIDTCLAIILLLFTAGIGLVIYLIIYYSKPENRCVHCNSICEITLPRQYPESTEQLSYQQQASVNELTFQGQQIPQQIPDKKMPEKVEEVKGATYYYCPFCGDKLENRGVKFCPGCGSKL